MIAQEPTTIEKLASFFARGEANATPTPTGRWLTVKKALKYVQLKSTASPQKRLSGKHKSTHIQTGGHCMKGSVLYRKDRGIWFVSWYDKNQQKPVKIYRYKGEYMYDIKIAEKLLALMQSDTENGTFRIEKYTGLGWTDTVPYLHEWLEAIRPTIQIATYNDYKSSLKNHLEPFFKKPPYYQLHEIQYDVLIKLLNSIDREGKGKLNVLMCLHACLKYAWKSRRIREVPPFPERKLYNIVKPIIRWLPEKRQVKIIQTIPKENQPIFWWQKYHYRRPGEAMAIHKEDYDPVIDAFIVRRGISSRKAVNKTKTGVQHVIPCHSDFKKIMEGMPKTFSPYLFSCRSSRTKGKRYTERILSRLWKEACEKCGEDIGMYDGLKKSSASQFINEKGGTRAELQEVGDWARYDSTEAYAKTEVARKRQLMEKKVIELSRNVPEKNKDLF